MSKEKQKGTKWETDVVNYLNENGFPNAERRALTGKNDKGDIAGLPNNWVLECKDHKTISLSTFVDEAMTEKENAGSAYGAAVIKRARKNVSQAYVVMPLEQFVVVMQKLQVKPWTSEPDPRQCLTCGNMVW